MTTKQLEIHGVTIDKEKFLYCDSNEFGKSRLWFVYKDHNGTCRVHRFAGDISISECYTLIDERKCKEYGFTEYVLQVMPNVTYLQILALPRGLYIDQFTSWNQLASLMQVPLFVARTIIEHEKLYETSNDLRQHETLYSSNIRNMDRQARKHIESKRKVSDKKFGKLLDEIFGTCV